MGATSLKFITPESGDWLIILDEFSGKEVYSGHGDGDEMWAVLDHLKVQHEWCEISDEEFQEKF